MVTGASGLELGEVFGIGKNLTKFYFLGSIAGILNGRGIYGTGSSRILAGSSWEGGWSGAASRLLGGGRSPNAPAS
jgi:hypothetical protein